MVYQCLITNSNLRVVVPCRHILTKGLAQGPYMAARAGVEPTTLRLKAIDSTKAPPCPKTWWHHFIHHLKYLFISPVFHPADSLHPTPYPHFESFSSASHGPCFRSIQH